MEIDILNLNTLTEVEKVRHEINEELDKRRDHIITCVEANKASKKSFGYIKEAFENISPLLFETKYGKNIINEYTNLVKTENNLSTMHSIYENLRKADSSTDIDFFINNITNTDWDINRKTINEDTKKLGLILAEGMIYLGMKSIPVLPNEDVNYSNAVEYIIENKKNKKNIAEYGNAVKIIKEHLTKKEPNNQISLKNINLDEMAERMVYDFNNKYANEFSDIEFKAIKELCETENRENVFNKYKQECIAKLNEAKASYESDNNHDAVEKMQNIIEQVSNKTFSLDNITTDISKFVELKEVF